MPAPASTPPESTGEFLPPRRRKPAAKDSPAPADPLRPFPASEQAEKAVIKELRKAYPDAAFLGDRRRDQ